MMKTYDLTIHWYSNDNGTEIKTVTVIAPNAVEAAKEVLSQIINKIPSGTMDSTTGFELRSFFRSQPVLLSEHPEIPVNMIKKKR
jgi:hypothetical protein